MELKIYKNFWCEKNFKKLKSYFRVKPIKKQKGFKLFQQKIDWKST